MASDDELLFSAVVSYETSGTDDVLADAQTIQHTLDSLSDGVDIPITTDVDESGLSELTDLENAQYDVNVDPIVDDSPLLELDALDGEEISPEIDPTESETGKGILDRLDDIRNLDAVDLVFNIAGTALDFLDSIKSFTVQPFLDLDDAVAKFNAQTGTVLPNARELFQNLLADDLGTSISQVGEVATLAQQLGLNVDEATRAALSFTKVFTDENPNEVLTTLNTLVSTGLAPNLQSASDLMTVFFQQGGNKGSDALSTIQQYSKAFADMGLTGPQALSVINTLMENGVASANEAARSVQALDDNLTTAANNPASDQSIILKRLHLENPKDSGQTVGADFINSFSAAIAQLPSDQQDTVIDQFFGKGGSKYTGAFTEMSTTAIGTFDQIKGAASDGGTAIDDSLTGAISDFELEAQTAMTNFLSSDQIDLPGKIDALKTGLQDGLATLQDGGSLENALTVALKPVGLDQTFQRLEDSLGNFIISILQVVAQIQDATGHGKEADQTRATITNIEKQQLPFDLKIANPDEIGTDVQTAIDRGLKPDDIAAAVGTAVTELVQSGSTDAAQQLLNNVKGGSATLTNITSQITGEAFPDVKIPISPDMTPEQVQDFITQKEKEFTDAGFNFDAKVTPQIPPDQVAALQKQINDAVDAQIKEQTTGDLNIGTNTASQGGHTLGLSAGGGGIDDASKKLDDLTTSATTATPAVDDLSTHAGALGTSATGAAQPVSDLAAATDDVAAAAPPATTAMNSLLVPVEDLPALTDPATQQLHVMGITADQMVTPLNKASDGTYSLVDGLNVLASQITTMAASLNSARLSLNGGGGGTVLNQTINTTSTAEANAAGQITVNGVTGKTN